VIHTTLDGWPDGRDTRGWDMASSSKQRDSDDPDWTFGVRGLVKRVPVGQGAWKHEVWIRSMVACREEAPKRDALIRATAQADGMGVAQHVEAFGGYKDAFTTLKAVLAGVSVVRASRLPGDKSAKLAGLEPSFDAACVHVYAPGCGRFLDLWREQFAAFPAGSHDDGPDATAVMYHSQVGSGGSTMLV
jgi:phage terminase large subunit-like protein